MPISCMALQQLVRVDYNYYVATGEDRLPPHVDLEHSERPSRTLIYASGHETLK